MLTKLLYAAFGCAIALFFMVAGFRLLAGLFVINISAELQEKNAAVGMVVMGMLIGVGVAVGLVVGSALN